MVCDALMRHCLSDDIGAPLMSLYPGELRVCAMLLFEKVGVLD